MKDTKHFVIDRSTWRFGGDGFRKERIFGLTKMLNEHGFMCCLGQCYRQLGFKDEKLLNVNAPWNIPEITPFFSSIEKWNESEGLVRINDNPTFYQSEREELLRVEFERKGLTIEFINEYPK